MRPGLVRSRAILASQERSSRRRPTRTAPQTSVSGRQRRLRLVTVEHVVIQATWANAGNTAPPTLFGQEVELTLAGNRYGLSPYYESHALIWKHNPAGIHQDRNPMPSCAATRAVRGGHSCPFCARPERARWAIQDLNL